MPRVVKAREARVSGASPVSAARLSQELKARRDAAFAAGDFAEAVALYSVRWHGLDEHGNLGHNLERRLW